MILKNNALQELYDTLTYGPITISPYADSPIVRAFKECDEKLSESATFAYIQSLENRCNNLERSNKALRDDNDKLGDKVIKLNKKNEQLEKDKKRFKEGCAAKSKENATLISANADLSDRLAKLQRNYDRINSLWTDQIQENMELRSKIVDLKREKEGVEKELDDAKLNIDGWRRRAEESEKRFGELLLKKYDQSFEDLMKERDRYSGLYTELKKDYDRLFEENRSLKSKIIDFKKRITELQKKGDDLSKKAVALQKKKNGNYKNGMYDLWSKLREVADSTYTERLGCFLDVCGIEDLVEWNLEDFLEEYEKWVKKRLMPENPNFYFDNQPVTMEATVEVDKNLLEKVCGIKPEEEEHHLDYGDAVRVPWKSYDYMYIGPEGKHIRLFDPKTHAVVLVSVTENLTYQGCKIILCDEDDIRKIWKDKK